MTFKNFQQDAIRTEAIIDVAQFPRRALLNILALNIAAGTLLDIAKKNIFYGKEIDFNRVQELIGTIKGSIENPHTILSEGDNISIDPRILHGVIGNATEATELLEAILPTIASNGNEPLDLVNIGEEIGDSEWYKAILTDATGLNLEDIQTTVIAKLKARYPDKYSDENALNRDLVVERAILEKGAETSLVDLAESNDAEISARA